MIKDIYGLKPNKRQLAKDKATYDDNEINLIRLLTPLAVSLHAADFGITRG